MKHIIILPHQKVYIYHMYRRKGTSTRHCWIVVEYMSNDSMHGQ